MAPIINDGYVIVVDAAQRDPRKLVGKMVAAREDDGVTIKWLRKDKDAYLLVPQHVSPRIPVKIMRAEDDWGIVGVVVKWIGYPAPASEK
jgi:SOS-response transcriptional repressor LexA